MPEHAFKSHHPSVSLNFGNGQGITVYDQCNIEGTNYCNIDGEIYQRATGDAIKFSKEFNFTVKEIEVFTVV